MTTTRTDQTLCHSCGAKIDAVSPAKGEAVPEPGDVTICFYCGAISKFDSNLKPVKISTSDLDAIQKQLPELYDRIMEMRVAILHNIKNRSINGKAEKERTIQRQAD